METERGVDGLVDRWEVMRDCGHAPTIEELCAGCPELAAEVRRRIEALKAMDSALDTEVDASWLTAPAPGCPDAGPDRPLAEVSRATAVYHPRCLHDQGGLGVVFAAHQEELDRTVALKRIRPDRFDHTARWRFLREAVLTARLQHPGIVPIYSLGQDDAGPFYTMPFIEGRTLQQAIDALPRRCSLRGDPGRRGLRLRELLQHFIAACNTVAYAHDQGVVHRDLKPSNLMLGPYGETLVMDWGLAKRLGADEAASEADGDLPSPERVAGGSRRPPGRSLGTPKYMSPEQARGEPVGPAGDIFSLGLVLYAILTGKSAFEESSFRGADRLKAVREAAIVPPRGRDPGAAAGAGGDLPEGAGGAARGPLCLGAGPGRRRDEVAGRRAGDGLARAVLSSGAAVGAAAPDGRDGGDGGVLAAVGSGWRPWRPSRRGPTLQGSRRARARPSGPEPRSGAGGRWPRRSAKAALAQSEESRKQAEAVSQLPGGGVPQPGPVGGRPGGEGGRRPGPGQRRLDKEFAGSQATQGGVADALGRTYMGLGLTTGP